MGLAQEQDMAKGGGICVRNERVYLANRLVDPTHRPLSGRRDRRGICTTCLLLHQVWGDTCLGRQMSIGTLLGFAPILANSVISLL